MIRLIILLLLLASPGYAMDFNLSWIANTNEPPIDHYRIYYKACGISEYVDVQGQNTTEYTLEDVKCTGKYVFTLTAYRDEVRLPAYWQTLRTDVSVNFGEK